MGEHPPNSAVIDSKPATKNSPAAPGGPSGETGGTRPGATVQATAFNAALEISALYERLQKVETGAKQNHDHWYNSQLFSSVLSGVILAVFGFLLTGRLEQAAKERELNIQSAQDMQALLVKMSTGTIGEAEAAAVSLTTYGRYSIPPLIESLQYPERVAAAERGLQSLALTVPEELCTTLGTVLQNRTQRYTAASHTAVIRAMGSSDCRGRAQIQILVDYADLIKRADAGGPSLIEYQGLVSDATPSNVTDAKKELGNTFRLLNVRYEF